MSDLYRRVGALFRNQTVTTHEGGLAYQVDRWMQLRRFLVLGSAGGTFYVTEQKLAREHAECVQACLDDDPARTVETIAEVSETGVAPKNDPALFALAMAAAHPNASARRLALAALPRVARTGTHLFHFAAYVQEMRGWGRGLRRAIGDWYQSKPLDDLAYQAIKYRQRDGWTHADLLRLAHPKTSDAARNAVYKWIVDDDVPEGASVPVLIAAFEEIQRTKPSETAFIAETIRRHRLPREAVPTELLNDPAIWDALLDDMPLTAMIRNLGVMTKIGLLRQGSDAARTVGDRLGADALIRKARVHPLAVLTALKVYQQGHGEKGASTWDAVPAIVDALDSAFYAAFGAIEPTGKRIVIGIDMSGSMGALIAGSPLSCREAAATMAMATARVERDWAITGYTDRIISLTITPRMRLDDVLRAMVISPQWTKCSLPITWARAQGIKADAIVSYTDSETADENAHPALLAYRDWSGNPTAGVIVGMTANDITLFPRDDARTLNVAGFDASAPAVVSDFISGAV